MKARYLKDSAYKKKQKSPNPQRKRISAMSELIPTRGKYLIEPISKYGKTSSGIYTAGSLKDIPTKGKVIAIGAPILGKRGIPKPQQVRIGDIVYLRKYLWKEFTYEGRRLLSVTEADIIGIERGDQVLAVRDMVIMKLEFEDKIGKIIIPDNRRAYRAECKGEVISIGPEYKYNLEIGNIAYILRMQDAFHEGIEIDTPQGKLWAVKERWVMGREVRCKKEGAKE